MEDLSQEPLIVPGQTQSTTLFSDSTISEADPQLALPEMSEESVLQQAELNNNNNDSNADVRHKRKGEDEGAQLILINYFVFFFYFYFFNFDVFNCYYCNDHAINRA